MGVNAYKLIQLGISIAKCHLDLNWIKIRSSLHFATNPSKIVKWADFARFAARWLRRVIDAVDRFSPDLIYFDGGAGMICMQ